MLEISWSCGWCGKKVKIPSWRAFLGWLPKYCPSGNTTAGPYCRASAQLANQIADKLADEVRIKFLTENNGCHLGDLRGHRLA